MAVNTRTGGSGCIVKRSLLSSLHPRLRRLRVAIGAGLLCCFAWLGVARSVMTGFAFDRVLSVLELNATHWIASKQDCL